MKVIFMGTPEFAVPTLRELIESQHVVTAVFCQPDRAKGRSKQPIPCPVKEEALRHQIPVFQPQRVRKRPWPQELRDLGPDVIVVAAYGHILSKRILAIPTHGCINVHASILPRWRGASPIHHAMLAGDAQTGVSTMRMVRELDAGPVYLQEKCDIESEISRVDLENRLAEMGARLLLQTLDSLTELESRPQDEELVTFAPIIAKEMGHCDFTNSAFQIVNMIRAFEDWPGVRCQFREKKLSLLDAKPISYLHATPISQVIERTKKRLVIGTGGNTGLELLKVQIAGKKAMDIHAFINGFQPELGETFSSL